MKILIIIAIFLLIGAFFIISNNNLRLNNKENWNIFFYKYSNWTGRIVDDGKILTGNLIKTQGLSTSKDK